MELDIGGPETRELIEGNEVLEGSFIELVLAASECSEDLGEISSPFTNFTPSTTFARYAKPSSFRQFFSAHSPSLNIMWSRLPRVTQPFTRVVR